MATDNETTALEHVEGVFDPIIAANNAAIQKLDEAIGMNPDITSSIAQQMLGWRNQLAAFSPTYDSLKSALSTLAPPPEEAPPSS